MIGLVTGESYRYRVKAQNEVGIGAASQENIVIAARVPDAPDTFELVSSTQSAIRFRWNLPYNGGSPVTHFQVWWDSGDKTDTYTSYAFTVDPDTEFLVEEHLTSGVFYAFKVIAVNAVGASELSPPVTYVAASVPGAPGKPVMVSRTESEIQLQWTSA
jgi:hypothetical protein